MIILKKSKKNNFIKKIYRFLNNIIYSIGVFFITLFFLLLFYYFYSGFNYSNPPKTLFNKLNEKILVNYLGLDLRDITSYSKIITLKFLNNFQKNKLEEVYIMIDQKSILGLEMQREFRKENGGELLENFSDSFPAKINLAGKNFKIKIRTKGVRNLHWLKKNQTSYKIDLKGDERIWGLEEFSIQKPITRNYTYEYLFHQLLGHVGLINIKYFFINLYINDENLGVYAVEESFSKELIERQKLRNGPIFGISEEFGEYYPNIKYELYSSGYWINEIPEKTKKIFSILNDIKNDDTHINDYFDLDKWAKYFAIMDLTGSYHGSLVKSVKNYYNPTTALFEPIGYDLHKGAGSFDNFILLDFLQEGVQNCNYLCAHKDWYLKFFLDKNKNLNFNFINSYIYYLKKYSKKEFLDEFIKKNKKELKKYNLAIYKDGSKTDKVTRKGLGYFIYDNNYLYERLLLINKRINSADLNSISISKENNILNFQDFSSHFPFEAQTTECKLNSDSEKFYLAGKMKINLTTDCKKIKIKDNNNNERLFNLNENIELSSNEIIDLKKNFTNLSKNQSIKKISNDTFIIDQDLIINQNTLLTKKNRYEIKKGKKINIINNSTLFIEGDIYFENDLNNQTLIYSEDNTGSIIFNNNKFDFKNVIFKNLSAPKLNNLILYGGVNIINSDVRLENITVYNSKNEDGINIINSKSNLLNLKFENIFADALDIDFGNSNFEQIKCYNVKNDCIDISGAKVSGNNLLSINAEDKGISVGENSTVNLENIKIVDSKIGIAVKDGSEGYFNKIIFQNNSYDIALFNKKNEFKKPDLKIENLKEINKKKILQSKNTSLSINNENLIGKYDDKEINLIAY